MKKNVCFLSFACGALLVGCGSGGGSNSAAPIDPATTTAEGQYNGTTNTNRTFGTVILEDGTFYAVYTAISSPNIAAGFIEGRGTSNNGTFSATNVRDYNLQAGTLTISNLSASYRVKESFAGSVAPASGGNSVTFSGTYDPIYERTPSLATLAGTYTTVDGLSVTIGSNGSVSGTDGPCMFSGTVAPRAKGNIYNTSTTYGPNCDVASGRTLSGAAVLDATGKRLTAVVTSSDKNIAAMFIGTRP